MADSKQTLPCRLSSRRPCVHSPDIFRPHPPPGLAGGGVGPGDVAEAGHGLLGQVTHGLCPGHQTRPVHQGRGEQAELHQGGVRRERGAGRGRVQLMGGGGGREQRPQPGQHLGDLGVGTKYACSLQCKYFALCEECHL